MTVSIDGTDETTGVIEKVPEREESQLKRNSRRATTPLKCKTTTKPYDQLGESTNGGAPDHREQDDQSTMTNRHNHKSAIDSTEKG